MQNKKTLITLILALLQCACNIEGGAGSLNKTGDTLIVSLPAQDSVIAVNPIQQNELKRIKVGKLPHNIRKLPNEDRLYVTIVGSQSVAEITSDTFDLKRTFLTESIPLTNKSGLAIESHNSEEAKQSRSCFDCHNGSVDSAKPVIVGSRPFGLAFWTQADKTLLLVANSLTANISFIDLESGDIVRRMLVDPAGDAHEPTEIAILDNVLYLSVRPTLPSLVSSKLRAYDLTSDTLLYETDVGPAVSDIKIDTTERVIYVSNFDSNTVEKFDESLQLLETFIVGNGPFGISLKQNKMFVANYYNNSISQLDTVTHDVSSNPLALNDDTYANPTHIAQSFDDQRLYLISGGTKGFILTLQQEDFKINSAMEIDGLAFDIININMTLEDL